MSSPTSYRSGFVPADFLAYDYRISGDVNIRTRPLADSLIDPTTDFVEIENVYVSPIQNPADIKASYSLGMLAKASISMVILAREEDGLSKRATYGDYMGRYTVQSVFLTVPGFEVRGYLETSAKAHIRTYMVTHAERFIPITEASAAVTLNPSIRFEGGMILVNKESVGIICMTPEEG
jgi:hypothetical protein